MRRHGFTLVEAIVVVILLGVVAGMTAPRLFRNELRRAEGAVESVAGVLGVVAQREAIGTVRMALVYDEARRSIRLERLAMPTDDDGRMLELSRRDEGEWRSDPLAPLVPLGPVRIDALRVDGESLDEDEWRIEFTPGEARPLVEMDLIAIIDGRERTWGVELLPYAVEATITETTDDAGRTAEALRSIDLDGAGLSEVPW